MAKRITKAELQRNLVSAVNHASLEPTQFREGHEESRFFIPVCRYPMHWGMSKNEVGRDHYRRFFSKD